MWRPETGDTVEVDCKDDPNNGDVAQIQRVKGKNIVIVKFPDGMIAQYKVGDLAFVRKTNY